jgi:hypothetical protein
MYLVKDKEKNLIIDFEWHKRCEQNQTLLDLIKTEKDKLNLENLLVKINFNEKNKFLYAIEGEINYNLNPLSQLSNQNDMNYKSYFEEKHSLTTHDLNQPLVELIQYSRSTSLNYLNKNNNRVQKSKYKKKDFYICEHLTVLPFKAYELGVIKMLPSIFYRLVGLSKAYMLKTIIEDAFIERSIIQSESIVCIIIKNYLKS